MQPRRPWMDAELEMLRDNARRFFERECVPHDARWRAQHHADREIWNKAGAAGLLCASIPEEYGGGGGGFLREAVICEEQMRAMAQAFSNNVHSGIVATTSGLRHRGAEAPLAAAHGHRRAGRRDRHDRAGRGTDLQRIKTQAGATATPGASPATRPSSPTDCTPAWWWWPARPAPTPAPRASRC